MTIVDRDSPQKIPLYFQLKQILGEKIENNEWNPQKPIPSEHELQDAYGLSRTTVRQALNELVIEGRLIRHRGKGTFIAPPKLTHSPDQALSLSQYMVQQGIKPGWQVLATEWVTPSPDVQEQLQLSADEQVYCIRRLRLADDTPIGHHAAYVPPAIVRQINSAGLSAGDSLAYLRHLPRLANGQARRTLEAIAAAERDAKLIGVQVGAPLLLVQRLLLDAEGAPLELMIASYRGDQFKYQITMPSAITPKID
jgi:GntR family transcriptional regulator